MLTALFVHIIIMSAALGITNHEPESTKSHSSDSPVGILDALLQRMYAKNSKPYESNVSELIGPKYEELLRKPLHELLEEKQEEANAQRAYDAAEKSPLPIQFRSNALSKPLELKKHNTTDSESDLTLENDDELQSTKDDEKLKESLKEKVSNSLKENLERTFTEIHQKNLKGYSKERVKESWKADVEDKKGFKDSQKKVFKENSIKNQPENLENTFKESLREDKVYDKGNEHQNMMKNNFKEQKLKELAQLEQVLRYFTQVMEQDPGYISNARSANINSTGEATKSNTTNNLTEEAPQRPPDLVGSTSSLNLTTNLTDKIRHLQANFSDDLNWYKPASKNLSQLVRQNNPLASNCSDDSATTDQNIELFQNFFSYHKIPYPVLSLYPLLANRSQIVSFANSTAHSSKIKPKHSWIHSGPSNGSLHTKNALVDPLSKVQYQSEKPTKLKIGNESNSLLLVNGTKTPKLSILPTTKEPVIPKKIRTQSELVKISPLPNFNRGSEVIPADLLNKCWIELNKTRSEVRLHRSQQPDAITCIIPRQNTSIFWGHTPEPVSKAKSGFYKFFNKKEKKEKKKKVTSSQPSTPSPITEMKTRAKPTTVFSTQRMPQETTVKIDLDHKKENEPYDEGINKILEDIGSKMCLPNMINRLLELVCQNVTNSSLTPAHSLHTANDNHQNHVHNHYRSHYNRTSSATRLGGNDSRKRWTDQHHGAPRDNYLRFKSTSSMNHHKNQESTYQRPNIEGKVNRRDLSDVLFLIGMNKDENIREDDITSNLQLKNNDIDVAYLRV